MTNSTKNNRTTKEIATELVEKVGDKGHSSIRLSCTEANQVRKYLRESNNWRRVNSLCFSKKQDIITFTPAVNGKSVIISMFVNW